MLRLGLICGCIYNWSWNPVASGCAGEARTPEPALIAKLFKRFLINAAKKQNRLQMSQVFSVSAHLWLDDFTFQGFYRAGPGT
jgi:hypothetical protein